MSTDPPNPDRPLSSGEISRRGVLGALAAIGLAGTAGFEFVAGAFSASATTYVQYQLPFPLNASNNPWSSTHSGYDFGHGGPVLGSPIPAIADGTVCHSAADPSNTNARGNRIEVSHADGAFSAYCHMRDAPAIGIGTAVTRGQTIGYVGHSGYVAGQIIGNHLHLGMSLSDNSAINGVNTFDPIPYIQARLAPAPSNQIAIGERDMATGFIRATTASADGTIQPAYIYLIELPTFKMKKMLPLQWAAIAAQGYSYGNATGDDIKANINSYGLLP
jgi:Peptidase family M23